MKKQYAVIGLGRFGKSVALTLAQDEACEVLAVDVDEDAVEAVADAVTYSFQADITEPDIADEIGLKEIDTCIIAIAGDTMETSVLATLAAKDAGVKKIIAKAKNEVHGRILKSVGADRIIYPEREAGTRLGKILTTGDVTEFFSISKEYSIVEMKVPALWVGKTLRELNIRNRYGLNLVGVLDGAKATITPDPDMAFTGSCTLIVAGKETDIRKMESAEA